MGNIWDEITSIYEEVFGVREEMKSTYKYILNSNWIIKSIFGSILLGGIGTIVFLLLKNIVIALIFFIFIFLITYSSRSYVARDIECRGINLWGDYQEKSKAWVEKFEERSGISLSNMDNLMMLEEITRHKIESINEKPTLLNNIIFPIKNVAVPIIAFIFGTVLSEQIDESVLPLLIPYLAVLVIVVTFYNIFKVGLFEYSKVHVHNEILYLILECKLYLNNQKI